MLKKKKLVILKDIKNQKVFKYILFKNNMNIRKVKEDFFLYIFEKGFFDFRTMKLLNIYFEIIIAKEQIHYFLRGVEK